MLTRAMIFAGSGGTPIVTSRDGDRCRVTRLCGLVTLRRLCDDGPYALVLVMAATWLLRPLLAAGVVEPTVG